MTDRILRTPTAGFPAPARPAMAAAAGPIPQLLPGGYWPYVPALALPSAQERALDAATSLFEGERLAEGSATCTRLLRAYQGLLQLVRAQPQAFRFLAATTPVLPGSGTPQEKACRVRLDLAVQAILAQGIARAEVRPDIDRRWTTEWLLALCVAPGNRPDGPSSLDLAVFDLFWHGIATPWSAHLKAGAA